MKKWVFITGCFIAGLGILGAAFSLEDEGHWESVEDFSGIVTITRTVDWETVMPTGGEEDARIIAKDNSYASILVKRTLKDGPYVRPMGLMSGYITAERSIVGASSGVGVKESFSGHINREYGADCAICGPEILVNKKRRLYKMSFTCPTAEGEWTRSMVPSGQVESHSGSAEICPHIPEPYRQSGDQGARYDPSSDIIMGNYSVTCYGDTLHDGSEAVKEEGDIFLRGTPDPLKCPIEYTVTWTFRIKKPDYKVKIIVPEPGSQEVFEEGQHIIWAQAEAEPDSYNDEIQPWFMDPIKGSDITIDPSPAVGPEVFFMLKKLPYDNDQFGRKKIYADNADPVEVKVFFKKKGKDNPGEFGNPNWFYYWKQGAVLGMEDFIYVEYIIHKGKKIKPLGCFAPPNILAVTDLAAEELGPITFPYHTPNGRKMFYLSRTTGVDTCARVVWHELYHKVIHEMYSAKIAEAHAQTPAGHWCDFDLDGIPDVIEKILEPSLGLKWTKPDTHNLAREFTSSYADCGDQEFLCWLEMQGIKGFHDKDWAFPGKQSNPKE